MSTTFSQMQTLLDAWGDAIRKRDLNQITMLRRTIDGKLSDLFKQIASQPTSPPPPGAAKLNVPRPPPPPSRPAFPPRSSQVHLKAPPLGGMVGLPRKIRCPDPRCKGTGIIEEGNAFLRCRACDGQGYTLSKPTVDGKELI